jgi:hypothetical protein
VSVRRRDAADGDDGTTGPEGGEEEAVEGGGEGGVSCDVVRTLWQCAASSGCPSVLLWLTLRGSSGEVELLVRDGLKEEVVEEEEEMVEARQRVPRGARLPLYLTGPPYYLRASYDGTCGWVAGEEGAQPILVRLVDSLGKQVVGLPFRPRCRALGANDSLEADVSDAPASCTNGGGDGDGRRCELTRVEWQRSGGSGGRTLRRST